MESNDLVEHKEVSHFAEDLEDDVFYNKRQLLSSILESKFYKSSEQLISSEVERKKLDFSDQEEEDEEEDLRLLETLEKRFHHLEEKDRAKSDMLSELQRAMENYNDLEEAEAIVKIEKVAQIDRDIKKTEDTLKSVNERFNQIKLTQLKPDMPRQ